MNQVLKGIEVTFNEIIEKQKITPTELKGRVRKPRGKLQLYLSIAKRGNVPPPEAEARVSSVINAPRGRHSEKPERVYELIESFYPTLKKIELFARQGREGWASWGNQVEAA